MLNKKQIITAGLTLGIALTTGFVMQNGDAVAAFLTDRQAPDELPAPVPAPVVKSSVLPSLSQPEAKMEPIKAALFQTEAVTALPDSVEAIEATLTCETTMRSEALAAAMVRLRLTSDCRPNERLSVHHEGLVFTTQTDAAGMVTLEVPALSANAVFLASFPNNEGAMTQIKVPSLNTYDRVVLQWRGESALQLHALEFGATYGEEGHVWSASSRDASMAVTGRGGFITTLGTALDDTAWTAEVYSFPTRFMIEGGTINLSVEAEITARNCAREIEAQTIQIRPNAEPSVVDMVLSVPECDAVGDFLVLDTMIEDLNLASK